MIKSGIYPLACLILLAVTLMPLTASAKLRVVSSLPDLAAVAKEVGGARVEVESLASHAVDPHSVDPRPNLIVSLNRADLLLVNGLELESAWLDGLVKQARNKKINPGAPGHFVAAPHAAVIEAPHDHSDRAHGHSHSGGKPHFLQDPGSVVSIANALRDRLSKLDPEGTEAYAANAAAFTAELSKVAAEQAQRFAKLPAKKRRVVSYHSSLAYTYRWLGLKEVATLEPKPGIPPNSKHVASVLKVMKQTGATVIVQEEYYPANTSETLVKMTKGHLVRLPGGTDFDAGERYITRLRKTAKRLYDAVSQ